MIQISQYVFYKLTRLFNMIHYNNYQQIYPFPIHKLQ